MLTLPKLLDADWARLMQLSGSSGRERKFSSNFSPRFLPVVLIRVASAMALSGWPGLANVVRAVNMVLFGLEVPTSLSIGPGLVLTHTQGTVLGAASIGSNVTIYHQVTLGANKLNFEYDLSTRPVVEDRVIIGVGAKILGPVRIGDDAIIGANAVVIQNVPPGATAVGVPAKVILK